jgi:hypothetical protein
MTHTPTQTATPLPTALPTLAPAQSTPLATPTLPDPAVACPGAPPSLFKIGDTAVVDFNDLGALRVLADPGTSVMTTRTQAYDNHRLQIIAGPVCERQAYYWYIRNLSQEDALGWVAEAMGNERYLCPVENPECAS